MTDAQFKWLSKHPECVTASAPRDGRCRYVFNGYLHADGSFTKVWSASGTSTIKPGDIAIVREVGKVGRIAAQPVGDLADRQ